jgi:amidase
VPAHRGNIATANAIAVDRLQAQGAIIFGKTNVPVMLADWQSFNPVYGSTNNPWDLGRTPGGSSGGAAAALAAGLTALELGSDIAASIRNPAHFCGLFGHKPSFGVVPQTGHGVGRADVPLDLLVCGPLARCADDLAMALDVLVEPEPLDPHLRIELRPARFASLKGVRVAVWDTDANCEVDGEVRAGVHRAACAAEEAGAVVDWDARPFLDAGRAHEIYIQLLRAATGPLLSDEEHSALLAQASMLGDADRGYGARNIRGVTQSHRHWYEAHRARQQFRLKWRDFFSRYDVLLCPVSATAAFPHNQETPRLERKLLVNGHPQDYNDQMFWAGLATLCYLPATVVPVKQTADGLPVGVQIIGDIGEDRTTIAMAKLLAELTGGFTPPAGYA